MSESFFVRALLSTVGGFLDTYISRGHVFANAQTGNIVLLGISLAQKQFDRAIYYFIPIMSFAIGVIIVEIIRNRHYSNIHWR